MPSFFDKLNTLVKSHINDIVSPLDDRMSRSRKKALSRQDIRGGLENDVVVLRKRIDDALAYEDELEAKINKLYQDIAAYDDKADAEVKAGRDDDARMTIGRMQQAQRELEMLEASLKEHQFITQEFISQVNMLEGTVEESHGYADDETVVEAETDIESLGEQMLQKLDETRRKMSDLISSYYKQDEPQEEYRPEARRRSRPPQPPQDKAKPATTSQPAHPVSQRDVDKDLEARLARLSKPEKDDDQ